MMKDSEEGESEGEGKREGGRERERKGIRGRGSSGFLLSYLSFNSHKTREKATYCPCALVP